jgi:hypothetical protein
MALNSWKLVAASLGAGALMAAGATSAVAAPGGDGSERGDRQRAVVYRSSESHEVIRYGDTPSGNFTFTYNADYGDAGSYQARELAKTGESGPYIQETHSREVVGSGSDTWVTSAHYANGRTQRP